MFFLKCYLPKIKCLVEETENRKSSNGQDELGELIGIEENLY